MKSVYDIKIAMVYKPSEFTLEERTMTTISLGLSTEETVYENFENCIKRLEEKFSTKFDSIDLDDLSASLCKTDGDNEISILLTAVKKSFRIDFTACDYVKSFLDPILENIAEK